MNNHTSPQPSPITGEGEGGEGESSLSKISSSLKFADRILIRSLQKAILRLKHSNKLFKANQFV